MFKLFKKKEEKKTPKYLVSIVGTSDVDFVYDDETLGNIVNAFGKENVNVTNWPLKF